MCLWDTFTLEVPIRELVFNEQIILEKLNKLNISKSLGPDGIHPRVLFELRYELLEPLNILFESSYKLGKLPDEWKLGHVTCHEAGYLIASRHVIYMGCCA